MGLLSMPSPAQRQRARPWQRYRRRPWTRHNDLAGVTKLFAAIPSLPRAELAGLTTRMIDRVDEIDGDADREPEPDEDHHDREQEHRHA